MKNRIYLFALLVVAIAVCACTKVEVKQTKGEVIAVKDVPVQAGSFPVVILTEGVWYAQAIDSWLSCDETPHINNYTITINHESNESTLYTRNFARVGRVAIKSYDGFVADTVVVRQRGMTPFLELKDAEIEASQTECEVVFNSNLTDACRPSLTFTASEEWVKGIEYFPDGVSLLVTLDESEGYERSTQITARFVDAWGDETVSTCTLTQKAL
jgi:hypothetical protein